MTSEIWEWTASRKRKSMLCHRQGLIQVKIKVDVCGEGSELDISSLLDELGVAVFLILDEAMVLQMRATSLHKMPIL